MHQPQRDISIRLPRARLLWPVLVCVLLGGLIAGALLPGAAGRLYAQPDAAPAYQLIADLRINEFLIADQAGGVANQYIELIGTPNTDYSAYSVLVVSGAQANPGQIYQIYPVGATSGSGYWTTFMNGAITQDANTLLLVNNLGGLIDVNANYAQQASRVVIQDSVAVSANQANEQLFSSIILRPDYDNLGQIVRGASRIPNGNGTQNATAWLRNMGEAPGTAGFAVNTPNAANQIGTGTPTATATVSPPTATPTLTATILPATATPTATTPGPTMTAVPSATPFPTAPPFTCAPPPAPVAPAGNCYNLLQNSGFEAGVFSPWISGQDPVPPQVVANPSLAGQRSALLGNPPVGGSANQVTYSSVRQLTTIPGDASAVYLRWRTWEQTQEGAAEAPGREQDRHDVILLSDQLRTMDILSRTRCNYTDWVTRQADISAYRGQTLYAYFNAYNDGNGLRTWQYLDDVELVICYPAGVTPGATPGATATSPCGDPMATAAPTPCPYAGSASSITPSGQAPMAVDGGPEIVIGASETTAPVPGLTPFIVEPAATATPIPEAPADLSVPAATTPLPPLESPSPVVTQPTAALPAAQVPGPDSGVEAARAARVPAGCTELIWEGDFEGGIDEWVFTPAADGGAHLDGSHVHDGKGGLYSLRVGYPVATNQASLSAAERKITLPDQYASLVLTFDYLIQAGDPVNMAGAQRADIYYMRSGQLARRIFNRSEENVEWRIEEEDLTALAGQPVRLRFSVNDERGSGVAMYVDNVSLLACGRREARASAIAVEQNVAQIAPTATLPPAADASSRDVARTGLLDRLLRLRLTDNNLWRTVAILFSILVVILFVIWGLQAMGRRRS